MDFYSRVVRQLAQTTMSREDSILVVCGGLYDAKTFNAAGFSRVLVTNVDGPYADAAGSFDSATQDAENLTFEDASFDWAVVHAGLHHCTSPHRALLEMCRVARKGVLVLEARDSFLVRAAVRLGLTVDYELEAVALGSCGLRNTAVPNFIYRWTEREVRKTIESAYPDRINKLRFFYGLRLPTERLTMSGPLKRVIAALVGAFAVVVQRLVPRQCNEFAFVVFHTSQDKPWIVRDPAPRLRPDFKLGFDPAKYKSNSTASRHSD